MVRLNTQNVQNEDDVQGQVRPLPGRYHAVIDNVNESLDKIDKIVIDFQVLAGTVPGQQGRVLPEYFAVTEKALPRLQRLAMVLGLIQPNAPEQEVSFADALGRQLVIEVEENVYEKAGKTVKGVRVAYLGFWSLGNAAVADVPKNQDALRLAAGLPEGNSNGNGKSKTNGTAAGQDKWGDL